MSEKFEFYDVLAVLVPGTLLLVAISLLVPEIAAIIGSTQFPEAFFVVILLAVSVLLGHLVQAVASCLEPLFDRTWGGRLSERALNDGLGDRYLTPATAKRIRTKLHAAVGASTDTRTLFLFAMQRACAGANSRAERFNALYSYHRALLTFVLIGVLLLAFHCILGAGQHWALSRKAMTGALGLATLILVWHRTKQRGYYFIREVLLAAEGTLNGAELITDNDSSSLPRRKHRK